MACTNLVLRYSFRGETIDHGEATSYIAVRQEVIGRTGRRNIGTAHLEVDPKSGQSDWYAFGPQLAQFLQVPTQGDAFAVLLTGSDDDRKRYLTSRRINLESVERMRHALDLPVDDELPDDLFEFLSDDAASEPAPSVNAGAASSAESLSAQTSTSASELSGKDESPLPPIDPNKVTIQDVQASDVEPMGAGNGRSGGVRLGPSGPVDHEQAARRQLEIGRRGEQAAVEAERRRLQGAGLDPSAVVWRSGINQFAPYDIESLDLDGQRIYIEVKATTGDDPSDPFVISQPELIEALRHQTRFYIYRVTRANTDSPRVFRYQNPAGLLAHGQAGLRLSSAQMWLGHNLEMAEPAGTEFVEEIL